MVKLQKSILPAQKDMALLDEAIDSLTHSDGESSRRDSLKPKLPKKAKQSRGRSFDIVHPAYQSRVAATFKTAQVSTTAQIGNPPGKSLTQGQKDETAHIEIDEPDLPSSVIVKKDDAANLRSLNKESANPQYKADEERTDVDNEDEVDLPKDLITTSGVNINETDGYEPHPNQELPTMFDTNEYHLPIAESTHLNHDAKVGWLLFLLIGLALVTLGILTAVVG